MEANTPRAQAATAPRRGRATRPRSVFRAFSPRFGPRPAPRHPAREPTLPGGPLFQGLRKRPFAGLPTGFLGSLTQRALGVTNPLVEFPEKIVLEQEGRRPGSRGHPGLTSEGYRLLPRLIETPQVVLRHQPARPISQERLALRLNLISEVDGVWCNTVVGRFEDDPARVGLITFHQLDGGRDWAEHLIAKVASGKHGQKVLLDRLPPRERDGAAPGSPTGSLDGIRQPPHGTKPLP